MLLLLPGRDKKRQARPNGDVPWGHARCTVLRFLTTGQTHLHAFRAPQKFVEKLLHHGGAGVLNLGGGMLGVLLPSRHPATQQIMVQLLMIPNAQAQVQG